MHHSIKVGFSFGVTSGIITTLGLMAGLEASTQSKLAVIGGILTIAIADAFSDALGIHISEESENIHTESEIWLATFSTFFFKFIFSLTFIVPLLVFKLKTAVLAALLWGMLVLTVVSWRLAKSQKTKPISVIAEHLFIAVVVVVITHFVGDWVSGYFQ